MLGVGDLGGTLHILEVPWSLSHPSSHEVCVLYHMLCADLHTKEAANNHHNLGNYYDHHL